MIWLKENDNMVGYVPVLNKSYSEKEIRKMSEFSCYEGWSDLSRLVMTIQGIGYEYDNGMDCRYSSVGVSKLINVGCSFDFECFQLKSDPRMETYIKQIYDVFSDLTLYKVQEKSIEGLLSSVRIDRVYLSENFVSKDTLDAIDRDIKKQMDLIVTTTDNFSKLLKLFADNDYPKLNDLFKEPDEDDDIWDEFDKERKIEKILVY